MDWSGVDYLWIIVTPLSAVWTLILTAPIHSKLMSVGDPLVTFLQICYTEETNSFTSCE